MCGVGPRRQPLPADGTEISEQNGNMHHLIRLPKPDIYYGTPGKAVKPREPRLIYGTLG